MEPSTTTTATAPTPLQSKLVEFRGAEYNVIKEGLAHILNPPSQEAASKATRRDLKTEDESQSVFYNPIQQFNRDLSVLAIRAFSEHVVDLKKQKHDLKAKKRTANGGSKGQKRKREDEGDQNQSNKKGEVAEKSETENPNEQVEVDVDVEAVGATAAPTATATATPTNGKQEDSTTTPSHQFTILDALSATGLRALRYASEIPLATKIVGNDLSPSAIQSMKTNIDYNELGNRIQPNLGDARAYMYTLGPTERFDVIDLDPYGTASPFMDAAVQGVKDGGLLCVTCTDAGVWASTGYAEKAFSLYGGVPIKGSHSHEGGLRLILNGLAMSAAKYGLSIEPLLSLSIDFYARTFVRVSRSPAQVKFVAGNTLLHYNCDSGCGAWSNQYLASTKHKLDKRGNPMSYHSLAQAPTAGPHCEHCGFKTHLAGPMWGGRLHNPQFIQRILSILPTLDKEVYQTVPRLEGMLTTALEEDLDLTPSSIKPAQPSSEMTESQSQAQSSSEYPSIIAKMDPSLRDQYPFYFILGALSKALHCQTPPIDEFRGAIHSIGYRSTRSHAKPNSIRTDAPWSVIWEIMREWVRQHAPVKEGSIKPGTPGAGLMRMDRGRFSNGSGNGNGGAEAEGSAEASAWLARLKTDLLSDIESGRDISDLVTKVEASLYRSGPETCAPPAAREETGWSCCAKGKDCRNCNATTPEYPGHPLRCTVRSGLFGFTYS
ncbi:tRNA (guanine(26)-N(2))-dimethyltransferase [Penicillium waksmanii]|uniref:tRNA (guanine(26)-N(2))-dimethyltransferase n=1 Tax=Penicillium waksmanii TaxID=69791 RepID=UPI0025484678|nr:tRNA (guanine(26)-N(2))-dimethyltransferase [Penicillium waksmanii]KAJ5975178.1 tRNA (guanine(26)-N(2))-dimethyltransferase [Penicillium waksmanii]